MSVTSGQIRRQPENQSKAAGPDSIRPEAVMSFVLKKYRYMGIHTDNKLNWKTDTEAVYQKGVRSKLQK